MTAPCIHAIQLCVLQCCNLHLHGFVSSVSPSLPFTAIPVLSSNICWHFTTGANTLWKRQDETTTLHAMPHLLRCQSKRNRKKKKMLKKTEKFKRNANKRETIKFYCFFSPFCWFNFSFIRLPVQTDGCFPLCSSVKLPTLF